MGTEYSAYAPTSTIAASDSILIVRAGVPYRFTGTLPVIDGSGNLGVGVVPGARLDVGGQDGTNIALRSTGILDGVFRGFVNGAEVGSLRFLNGGRITIETAGTERLRLDENGNLLVGVNFGSYHRIEKAVGQGGTILYNRSSTTGQASFYTAAVSQEGFSSSGAAAYFGRSSVTNRSVNAGGTINASGADYAEYMVKADGCGEIAKGDVCGVDRDGQLTRTWADAISFVVKSTDPSYVGGDSWGIGLEGEVLEGARRSVDRIAFSGQVPVNVDTDTLVACDAALAAGDAIYLIAVANGGGIGAAAVLESEMTLPLYMRRLGKVWAIRDGRPIIDVQHG